jgi:hypothetical protein
MPFVSLRVTHIVKAATASISSIHFNGVVLSPLILVATVLKWASTAQPVQRLATDWTVQESNPVGGEIFRTCPDRPERIAGPSPLLVPLVMKE